MLSRPPWATCPTHVQQPMARLIGPPLGERCNQEQQQFRTPFLPQDISTPWRHLLDCYFQSNTQRPLQETRDRLLRRSAACENLLNGSSVDLGKSWTPCSNRRELWGEGLPQTGTSTSSSSSLTNKLPYSDCASEPTIAVSGHSVDSWPLSWTGRVGRTVFLFVVLVKRATFSSAPLLPGFCSLWVGRSRGVCSIAYSPWKRNQLPNFLDHAKRRGQLRELVQKTSALLEHLTARTNLCIEMGRLYGLRMFCPFMWHQSILRV